MRRSAGQAMVLGGVQSVGEGLRRWGVVCVAVLALGVVACAAPLPSGSSGDDDAGEDAAADVVRDDEGVGEDAALEDAPPGEDVAVEDVAEDAPDPRDTGGGNNNSDSGGQDAGPVDADAPDSDGGSSGVCALGGGFAASASVWTLPPSVPSPELATALDQQTCAGVGDLLHTVLDLTGDRVPELAVTSDCDLAQDPGRLAWSVYNTTASGFAEPAVVWPTSDYLGQIDAVQDQSACTGAGDVLHTLKDMNGDLRPDLVVTSECDLGPLGRSHWAVHLNTNAGFNDPSIQWALPERYNEGELGLIEDQRDCIGAGDLLHLVEDLNGDRRPDLVVTSDCDVFTQVGRTRWSVHLGDGDGFASSPRIWNIPSGYVDGNLSIATDQGACAGAGDALQVLRDMDGDERPDLVVTSDCDGATELGQTRWHVHRNTGLGFEDVPVLWTLPSGFGVQLGVVEDQAECVGGADVLHMLRDVDGDMQPDLVITSDCNDASPLGRTEWAVYLNTGRGFATAPAVWTLPSAYPAGAFSIAADQGDCARDGDTLHVVGEFDARPGLDLVVTSDCLSGTPLGTSQWALHSGQCAP